MTTASSSFSSSFDEHEPPQNPSNCGRQSNGDSTAAATEHLVEKSTPKTTHSEQQQPPREDDHVVTEAEELLVPFPQNDTRQDKESSEDELLVPFPRQDDEADTTQQQTAPEEEEGAESSMNPLDMMRKGAVAVAGGTMVGVGLVMIPLPTPFGAVIAGGGMAVLGTEFKGAKEMNEKVLDSLIEGIESLEGDNADGNSCAIPEESKENEGTTAQSEEQEDSPEWLRSAPLETRVAEQVSAPEEKEKSQNPLETSKKALSSFLSRNVLPFLRKTRGEYQPAPCLVDGSTTSMEPETATTADSTFSSASIEDEEAMFVGHQSLKL